LSFGVQQLENDFSDALGVRQGAQRGVEHSVWNAPVLPTPNKRAQIITANNTQRRDCQTEIA